MKRAFPKTALPADVAKRLEAAHDEATAALLFLIRARGDGDFSDEAAREHGRLIRRIAVISAAMHERDFSALTSDERTWLRAQGVPVAKTFEPRAGV